MTTQLSLTAWQSRQGRGLRPFFIPTNITQNIHRSPVNLTGMFSSPGNMDEVQSRLKGHIHGLQLMPAERLDKPEQWVGAALDATKRHEILVDYFHEDRALADLTWQRGANLTPYIPGNLDVVACVGCPGCVMDHATKIHHFLSTFDFGVCGFRPADSTRPLGGLTIQVEMPTFGRSSKLDLINAVLEACADRRNNMKLSGQFGGVQLRGFELFSGSGRHLSKKAYMEVERRTIERNANDQPQISVAWKERPNALAIWQGGDLVNPGCGHQEMPNREVWTLAQRFARNPDLVNSQFPTVPISASDFVAGWPAAMFGPSLLPEAVPAGPSHGGAGSNANSGGKGKGKKGGKK